jgi:radical SAM protein with 4Fe4S-binding SPASM domain
MSSLNEQVCGKALKLGVPLHVHLDVTYRCNERCIHCYLDHEDHGEMTTAEIKGVLDQLAEAGTFHLTISGGEIMLRPDLFEIVRYARSLLFAVKLKTNGILIGEKAAERIKKLGVQDVQISIYSHRPEVHDLITKVPGSLHKSIEAIRFLKAQGLRVRIAIPLMRQNMFDYPGVKTLAEELGVGFTLDPTITPKMDGDHGIVDLRIPGTMLKQLFTDKDLVNNPDEFCLPSAPADENSLSDFPCSAGHTAAYISPYGDVYPCVQFPLPCGNLRSEKFLDVWRDSKQLQEVRSIHLRDLPTCSGCSHVTGCTRCPGLAYQEGNMRGPSTADCEKSFMRTGIPTANMIAKSKQAEKDHLVQIETLVASNASK